MKSSLMLSVLLRLRCSTNFEQHGDGPDMPARYTRVRNHKNYLSNVGQLYTLNVLTANGRSENSPKIETITLAEPKENMKMVY